MSWPLVFWGIEAHKSGNVHHNLVLAFREPMNATQVRDVVRSEWLDITGDCGSERRWRELYGVVVQNVWDVGGAAGYLIKELSKTEQKDFGDVHPGRWWGINNRAAWSDHRAEPDEVMYMAEAFGVPVEVIRARVYMVNRQLRPGPMRAVESTKVPGRWYAFDTTWHVGAAVRFILATTELSAGLHWQDLLSVISKRLSLVRSESGPQRGLRVKELVGA